MFSKKMDESEFAEQKPVKFEGLWNGLTLVTLVATLAAVVVMLVIFNDPKAAVNPFPPPELPEKLILPTATATMSPTAIPTATSTPSIVSTLELSAVPTDPQEILPSATPEVLVVPGTPSLSQPTQQPAEEGQKPRYAFELQTPPQALSASLYNPEHTCEWMGVAGRVFDNQARPVKGIRVALVGYLGVNRVDLLSLSGTALYYGPSGFEFTLASQPIASNQRLSIQLFDQSDLPLSPKIDFDTYAECEANLTLIDFVQVGD